MIRYTEAPKVAPDLFHDMKRITSKMNNGNKRHKWACTAVKLSFLHRDRGDELKVDAALMAGKLSGMRPLPTYLPLLGFAPLLLTSTWVGFRHASLFSSLGHGHHSGYKLFGQRWPKDYKFSAVEIASFKELKFDPVSGRKVKCGVYWETFDETIIREVWNPGMVIGEGLKV